MATIYSLICFAGKDGKTVTFTDAGDVVNLTNHGLRDGTGVVFTDNAGNTLPTGLSKNTTYYSKSTGANTFTIYTTSGLTTQVTFTGTGSGTHKVKSAYYYNLSDKSRWTVGGTEYIFDSLNAWNTHRTTTVPTNLFTDEVCEIGMAWTDATTFITISMRANTCTVTTMVNGSRSGAFHNGVVGDGYILPAGVNLTWFNIAFDGFTLSPASGTAVELSQIGCGAYRVIVTSHTNHAFAFSSSETYAISCLVCGGTGDGFYVRQYINPYIFNCQVSKQTTYGFQIGSNPAYGFYYNNISIGNTTANWGTKPSGLYDGSGNAGLVGDTPWNSAGGKYTVIATTDFTNYAGNVFTPAAITSPQVETGIIYPGDYAYAIDDDVRPSYPGQDNRTAAVTVNAGSFVTGLSYTIASMGSPVTDFTACGATSATFSASTATDQLTLSGHTYSTGDTVYLSAIGTITGVSTNTIYYVVAATATTIQLATSVGGSAINLTGTNDNVTVVQGRFKATGAGTNNGTATLNANYDIGPYEYDLGYGAWPTTQPVSITGIADGSRVKITKQSDGTELYATLLSGSTSVSYTEDLSADTDVYVYIRKGSATPYYKPLRLSSTIDSVTGMTLSVTGLQIEDIAAASYTAGVATDWTFNSGTGAITHASGTTRYSVQDLYSWHQDYYDGETQVDDNPLINGITPTQFELINSATISDYDLRSLYGGSIEFTDGSLWSSLYTAGSLAASHNIYVVQDDEKLFQHWAAGHIDILVQVKE